MESFVAPRMPMSRLSMSLYEIEINEGLCKGCGYCGYVCEYNVLTLSIFPNEKGYLVAVVQHPEACTGCGDCEMICPEFAIRLETEYSSNSPEHTTNY